MARTDKLITGRLTVYLCLLTAVIGLMMSLHDCKPDKGAVNKIDTNVINADSINYQPISLVED